MMPKPDGTHTRAEHAKEIFDRYQRNLNAGMADDEAMSAAGAQWREQLRLRGEAKIAAALRALGIKSL